MFKDQKRFDRNNDGRLNSREWSDWYFRKYGFDIEKEELRHVRRTVAGWEGWLNDALNDLEEYRKSLLDGCKELMKPWSAEKERLADRIFVSKMLSGVRRGKTWDIVLRTDCGQIYVYDRTFRPYQELARAFLSRHPSVCSFSQFQSAARGSGVIFPEECALTEDTCGRFWSLLIDALPPYSEEAAKLPEKVLLALFDCELTFMEEFSSEPREEDCGHLEMHWIARHGTAEDIERKKVLSDAQRLFAELGDRVSKLPELSLPEINELAAEMEPLEESVECVEPLDECSEAWEEWNAVFRPIEAAWRRIEGRQSALEVAGEIEERRKAREHTVRERQLSADPALLDREYTCCSVFVGKARREYLYLAPEEPVSVGDKVTVPLGNHNFSTTGEIRSIDVYTGKNAPYPPWEMKKILRIEETETDTDTDRCRLRDPR